MFCHSKLQAGDCWRVQMICSLWCTRACWCD